MESFIVAVKDRALDAFGRPFSVPSLGVAIRAFGDMVNGGEGEFSKHPEDYDLYHLGMYEDQSGKVWSLEIPLRLAVGKQLVTKGGNGDVSQS